MAEATRPGQGGVNCYQSFPELKTRKVVSAVIDISLSGGTVIPVFYDVNHDAYITQVNKWWVTGASATSATLNVGLSTDTDGLVDAEALSQTASAGDVEACTLTTAQNESAGQATGFYRVPAGTAVLATVAESANTGAFKLEINYVLLDKGI